MKHHRIAPLGPSVTRAELIRVGTIRPAVPGERPDEIREWATAAGGGATLAVDGVRLVVTAMQTEIGLCIRRGAAEQFVRLTPCGAKALSKAIMLIAERIENETSQQGRE